MIIYLQGSLTRRAGFSILLLCCLCFPVADAQGQNPQQLRQEFNAAYQAEDWPRAIDVGLRLLKAVGRDPGHAYNLACVFARNGDREDALLWLHAAGEFGFAQPTVMADDADLDSVREDPRFTTTLERIRENQAAEEERFRKLAADSEPIVVLPGGKAPKKPAPLLVVLHGFGHNSEAFVDAYRSTAGWLGAILVAPRSVLPVDSDGFEWGTVEQAESLMLAAIEEVSERYPIDRDRILLSGFSQGGFMAFQLAARNPKLFRGVVPLAGAYRPEVAKRLADAESPPHFYLLVGSQDGAVDSNRQGQQELQAAGVTSRLKIYPNLGHNFPPNHEQELLRAFRFVLKE